MTLLSSKADRAWMWALLPLLLAAALVIPALDRDIFDVDESSTMINAGARYLGPYTPAEAVARSLSRSPDQAWGLAISNSLWGRVFGWSESSVRALPWFAGLLTLAWVYRTGRDLFTPRIALTATLLLSTSVFFLTYMHKARSYAPAILFATICLWAYWRVALRPCPAGRGAQLALLTGAAGLLYSNYFCALLLPALALFHLIFVRKDRRWWRPVMLLGLAALLALPQVPGLLSGIQFNQAKEELHQGTRTFPEIISLFLRYLSNGLLEARWPANLILAIALPLLLAFAWWRNRRRKVNLDGFWYLLLTGILLLLLLLGANAWLQVFNVSRVRYLSTLWPPAMLLIAMASLQMSRTRQRATAIFLLVTLMALPGTSDFLNEGYLASSFLRRELATVTATRMFAADGSANGLLALEPELFEFKDSRSYKFYTSPYEGRRVYLEKKLVSDDLLARAQGLNLVWLLFRNYNEETLHIHNHIELLKEAGWFHSSTLREAGVTLVKLVSPAPFRTARLQFENVATLFPPEDLLLRDGRLYFRANLHSADATVLDRYSLAVHVIDSLTEERVAQNDVGAGPGKLAQLFSEIDISALPPGDYEVRVALYDWQSGERLLSRDLETDEVSDMHTLHQLRVD